MIENEEQRNELIKLKQHIDTNLTKEELNLTKDQKFNTDVQSQLLEMKSKLDKAEKTVQHMKKEMENKEHKINQLDTNLSESNRENQELRTRFETDCREKDNLQRKNDTFEKERDELQLMVNSWIEQKNSAGNTKCVIKRRFIVNVCFSYIRNQT